MEILTTDELDHQLIHALRLDPRVPFARFASLTGVSEQTAARRFRRLREHGVLRVHGLVDPFGNALGNWMVRIRARPDAAGPLADALAQRPDVSWVSLTAGGTEILCAAKSHTGHGTDGTQELLLRRLPHTKEVIDFTAQLVMHRFDDRLGSVGNLAELDEEQVTQIRSRALVRDPEAGPVTPIGPDDDALLAELRDDGRTPVARLAQATGWSPARVHRRLDELVRSGLFYFDLELAVELVGLGTQATIWLTVAPADLDRVGLELAEHKEIAYVAAISGSRNLMASAITRDPEHLYRYVTHDLGGIPGIQQIEISPILRRLKQAGSFMHDGRLAAPVS
ncbi:Lrp/AsnC family transcriptional regulator [Kineosporia succinea]|uniref:DNA-binding Lrp family transcriptional regulator n=1 Tax=Kineosporia succinea TaxID=84632 RepID=A0ABT9P930_9ACTN|nr:Lrp/AsnC family transcriptional regulator [Kineosporia succinea]MDP9829207.1 DNA-binding Lrp family transcriptional regulator [Kineosporia succinea]